MKPTVTENCIQMQNGENLTIINTRKLNTIRSEGSTVYWLVDHDETEQEFELETESDAICVALAYARVLNGERGM